MTNKTGPEHEDTRSACDMNPELIPTRELMRMRRKADWQKAKAQRKADNLARKNATREAKREAREERDKQLWAALRRGSELETTPGSNQDPDQDTSC
jgi:hypothetical protein